MQFVEASPFGVRSARLTLTSPTCAVRVTLFPMIHVADPSFYEETYLDAREHDMVLLEGVDSPIVKRITRSYRWLVGSRAMAGLIVQPKFVREGAKPEIIRADLTATEFAAAWSKVPIWQRAIIFVAAPAIGLHRRWFSTRRGLAKDMQVEDQPSLKELLALDPDTGALTRAILDIRDGRLIDSLRGVLDTTNAANRTLAVIYGAAHMRAVVRELVVKGDFQVSDASWHLVLDLD